MAFIDIFTNVFSAAKLLYDTNELVKANKAQCKVLVQRVEIAMTAVKGLEKTPNNERYRPGLIALENCLKNCQSFIASFTKKKSWFRRAWEAGDVKDKFIELKEDLNSTIELLQLGMDTKQFLDNEQDKKAQIEDQKSFKAQQKELRELNEKSNQEFEILLKQQKARDDEHRKLIEAQLASLQINIEGMKKQSKHIIDIDPNLHCNFFELKIGDKIGQGSFGTIYKGEWNEQVVAIKKPGSNVEINKDQMKEFIREVQIMARLRSPNVVQLYGVCMEDKNLCFIMEYMPNGSLYEYLSQNKLSAQQCKKIALDIAKGLLYLHSFYKGEIVHRDLKSANILLTSGNDGLQAKITDFGMAKMSNTNSILSFGGPTQDVAWLAPECFMDSNCFKAKSDVYSFGVILWELVTNKRPFADIPQGIKRAGDIFQKIRSGGEREAIPSDIDPVYVKLIKSCWELDPDKRPTMREIVKTLQEYTPKAENNDKSINSSDKSAKSENKAVIFSISNPNSPTNPQSPPSPRIEPKAESEDATNAYEKAHTLAKKGGKEKADKVFNRYKKAAELGSIKAHTEIGLFYLKGKHEVVQKDLKTALDEFTLAAQSGHARAMLYLGDMYRRGDGVAANETMALKWYKNAEKHGDGDVKSEAKKKIHGHS